MEVNFDLLNKEFGDTLQKAFAAKNLDILEQTVKHHFRSDTDWKQALDQAFREVLLDLLKKRVPVTELKNFVEFCIQSCRKSLNTPTMPVVLLGDTFESLTLDKCEEMFNFVEINVDVWKEELFFTGCKNNLLRLCNDLLRRLSRSTATVFCGKILLFLAKFFPFSERSGLNIVSEFNLENITEYGQDPDDMDIQTEIPSSSEEQRNIIIDFTFYSKFWQLQDFFRNPNQCYNKIQWKQFCSHSSTILNTFQGIKIDYVNSGDRNVAYFPKYLTSQKLLDLQLYDVNFRRSVLLQFLIVFQYLTSSVKFKSDAYELKSDQKDWIQTYTDKVYNLLRDTPPDGENFARITQQLMTREQLWNSWKNDGCPEIKRPVSGDVETRTDSNRPLLGDVIKEAQTQGKYYLGSGELTKLWNFCPNNLEACKAKDRDFLPSLEDYFADAIEQVEAGVDAGEATLLKDSNFGWRALRLLARRSPHFFTYSQNIIHPLSHYLDMMVRKTAHERPGRSIESIKDDSQNENELDENILTEEEQNAEELKQTDGDEFVDEQNLRRHERKSLTDEQLELFSEKLATDWPRLASKVGYKDDEIEFIKKGHQNIFDQAKNWLKLYFDDDEDATLDNFLYILEGLQMDEIAEVVRQEINNES